MPIFIGLLFLVWCVARRSATASWVAEVATPSLTTERPDRSRYAGKILAEPDEIAQHLAPKDSWAFRQRVVTPSANTHRARQDRVA
jgi:hypothetical protein